MKKIKFQWKTILKGICVLLLTCSAVPLSAQQMVYSPSNVVPVSAGSSEACCTSCGQTCASTGNSYCGTCVAAEMPDGLFLHRFNQSPAAYRDSCIFGPGSFFIDGHISQGLTYSNADSKYYSPLGTNDREGYQMNQVYLSFGRKVVKADRFSIGGQIDLMYGTDYYYMSSAGLENGCDNSPKWNGRSGNYRYRAGRNEYGFSLPQAFVEMYIPAFALDVKAGHFDSIMGYESLQSNKNFFYSHSYSRIYGMPTSMTGAIATMDMGNDWQVIFGGVTEWNAFDTENDNLSGVFGLQYESYSKFFTFNVTGMYGKQTSPCYQFETSSDQETNTFVLNTFAKFQLTHRLSYVCEFTAGYDDREYFCMETFGNKHGRAWYGLNNYLFYKVNEQLTLGTRFEWFCDTDNTVIDGGYGYSTVDDSVNYFALTVGANWTPYTWLTIRPEVRYDFSDYDAYDMGTYDDFSTDNQVTFGTDVIIRF